MTLDNNHTDRKMAERTPFCSAPAEAQSGNLRESLAEALKEGFGNAASNHLNSPTANHMANNASAKEEH